MGRHASEELQTARYNVVDILTDRFNGASCRDIAEKHGLPEHTIHTIMKETGYAGRFRARPRRIKALRKTHDDIMREIESAADELVVERSADGEGWIVSIDDVPGSQERTIEAATRSAYEVWKV